MDYYQSVVLDYLQADRAIFLNAECCIQLNCAKNPDTSGPHWYCDAIACDFRAKCIFLCEISYELRLVNLTKRLRHWHENWPAVCHALARDSHLPSDWPVRPWLFVPEQLITFLEKKLLQIPGSGAAALNFVPRITPLEKVQPWHYKSWNRIFEEGKAEGVPAETTTQVRIGT